MTFSTELPAGDYVSPGFERINLDFAFPHMGRRDRATAIGEMRRDNVHPWYVDTRAPHIGWASRDEAHILYNTALKYPDAAACEIGCWMGWSACHLAAGGVTLDIIDPLPNEHQRETINAALAATGLQDRVQIGVGHSPAMFDEPFYADRKWGLFFIDANHDGEAPMNDVKAVERHAAEDCIVLFHDLCTASVERAVAYLRDKGWNVMIYHTIDLMAVAWRGKIEPVEHIPDPALGTELPDYLSDYKVSGR